MGGWGQLYPNFFWIFGFLLYLQGPLAAAFSDGSYLAHVNGAYLRHVTFCIVRYDSFVRRVAYL